MTTYKKIFSLSLLMFALGPLSETSAATATINANMTFDTPLSMTKGQDVNFGTVRAGQAGIYVITPDGSITVSGGGAVIGGSAKAAQITVTGSGTQTISVQTGNYVASGGVLLSAASCGYNNIIIPVCDLGANGLAAPTAAGKVIKIGVTAVVDGSQLPNTVSAPTFVVTVI